MNIKGFKAKDGNVYKYDFNELANLPETPEGEQGADGGYYTPAVTQPTEDTLQFDFTPSKAGMPAVEPVQVKLPAPDSGGNVDLTGYVQSVNGVTPDENGNVEVEVGSDYELPVGGDELGGVKNGGNVTINEDGTMTAPESAVSDEQVASAVSGWLEANPDATTTVQDGSITQEKLSDALVAKLGLEPNHNLTEVKIDLSYCQYAGWSLQTGSSGFRATVIFPTPQFIKIVSHTTEYGVSETIKINACRFANSDDEATATFAENKIINNYMSLREGMFLKAVSAADGETVIVPTNEYGASGREYMQVRFNVNNFGKDMGLFDVYAVYDTWRPTYKLPEAGKIYEEDLPIKWVYRGATSAKANQVLWGIAPYYPDFTYHIRGGYYPTVAKYNLNVAYLFDDTIFDGYVSGLLGTDNSVPLLCGDGTKNFVTTQYDPSVSGGKDSNYAWAYHKTPPESELTGPKWIAFTMGSIAQSSSTDMGEDYYNQLIRERNDAGAQYLYISRWEDKDAPRRLLTTLVRKAEGFQDEGSIHDILVSGAENPMRNARWVIFADSLADAYGGHDLTGNYFASRIAREFGLRLDNRAKGGSNIYAGGSGNYTSVSGIVKLDEYLAEIEAGTTEQADYITVAFGTNAFKTDIGTNEDTSETYTASMYGATKYFIEKIREKVPNAVLGFVLPPRQQWPSSADPNGVRDIDSARTAIKTVCEDYGVPYIDMSTQSGITMDMLPDGIHISSDQSQKLYYHAMRRFMMGL